MSKRRQQASENELNKRARPAQKHLYVALDDWENGYSIRKIDAGADGPLEPAVLRVAAPELRGDMTFAALGDKIVIATDPRCAEAPTLVYDTAAEGLTVGPRHPAPLVGGSVLSVAVGGTLYALTAQHHHGLRQDSFEALSWGPAGRRDPWCPHSSSAPPPMAWAWKSVPSPPPLGKDDTITGYAAHPDGRTVFVSARNIHEPRLPGATFSFDADRGEWRRHGAWCLPFRGQACFDTELDAWVGLDDDGAVCACRVASRSSTSAAPPEAKTVREFVASETRHLGSTLCYMGDTKFCLVECVLREGVEYKHAFFDRGGWLLRVTTFGLKYSHRGELQATVQRATTSRVVSKYVAGFTPAAFWM